MAGPEAKRGVQPSERLRELVRQGFTYLLRNHPLNNQEQRVHVPCIAPHDLRSVEGKSIKAGEAVISNQCAVRFIKTFLDSGVPLDTSKVLCCGVQGHEGHVIRARDAAVLFENAVKANVVPGFAPAKKLRRSKILPNGLNEVEDFFSRPQPPGAVYITNYWQRSGESGRTGAHIDIWNGYRTPAKPKGSFFAWLGARTNYALGDEVWFWENTAAQPENTPRKAHIEHNSPDDSAPGSIQLAAGSVATIAPRATLDTESETSLDRRQLLGRAAAIGVMGYVSSFFLPSAQARTPEIVRGVAAQVQAFEKGLAQMSAGAPLTLKTIFQDVHIPRTEHISEADKRTLFGKMHLGYLSSEDTQANDLLSFPIAPVRARPPAPFTASSELPTKEMLEQNPLTQIFDGSYVSWFGIRTGEQKMLTPELWVDAVQRGLEYVSQRTDGFSSRSFTQAFVREYGNAGTISFDESLAKNAHATWASLCWLKNPDITENGPADNNARRQWTPHMTGGFAYDIKRSPELGELIEQALNKFEKTDGSLAQKQCALIRQSLPKLNALVLGSRDVGYFNNIMQYVSGAAITKPDGAGVPKLIGQAQWVIPVKAEEKDRIVVLYTNPEETKRAYA